MLAGTETHLTVAEFWRFWVVHLWVEDFLELFTTVMVAYIFVMLGVVRRKIAIQIIFLDVILYSAGGVIGTMHHLYFSGTPVEHMALGAFFSALEVIPLTFLTVEAWTFLQLGSRQQTRSSAPFPHRWAVMFLVAVGFWNFVGAGVFGFLINLPIVSYFQIGTALTANHAHGAMMGVYGMMAVGSGAVRAALHHPGEPVAGQAGQDLVLVAQHRPGLDGLRDPAAAGRAAAVATRSTTATTRPAPWATSPSPATPSWSGCGCPVTSIFIVGGVLPFLWITWLGVRYGIKATTTGAAGDAVRRGAPRGRGGPHRRAGRCGAPRCRSPGPATPPTGVRRTRARGPRRAATRERSIPGIGRRRRLAGERLLPAAGRARLRDRRAGSAGRVRRRGRAPGGFTYHEDHDAWTVPEDQWLWPQSFDPENRVMRYRGSPTHLQRLPGQGHLHHVVLRAGGAAGRRRLAGLGGGPVPPGHRLRRGRARTGLAGRHGGHRARPHRPARTRRGRRRWRC